MTTGASDDEGPLAVGYNWKQALAEGRSNEFHAWVVGNVGDEIHAVDFTIGDFEQVAARLGIPWSRVVPTYIWGGVDEVQREGIWYESDPLVTAEAESARREQAEVFLDLSRKALDICAAAGVTGLYLPARTAR